MTEDEYSRIENGVVVGEAILFMRSRPKNRDGSIGFCVRPDQPEWAAWEAYFEDNHMRRQLGVMRTRKENGYMVPCANPSTFDPQWRYRPRPKRPENALPKTAEERNAILARLAKILPGLSKHVEKAASQPHYEPKEAAE